MIEIQMSEGCADVCYSEIWPKKVFLHDETSAAKININLLFYVLLFVSLYFIYLPVLMS